ncbi:MAG: UpxY family transcription antiterminator [bacterium]
MKWYVLYTKSRCEKKVSSLLSKRDIENYCPLNRVIRQWSDRKKVVHEPLFSSYVFVRSMVADLSKIKQTTNDIVNFVYWLGNPAVVRDEEIELIRQFMGEYSNVKLEKITVNVNDHVRITNGPLVNNFGQITEIQNNKVRLHLPTLGYAAVAEINLSNIEVVDYPYRVKNMIS